jgi:two-component system nitrate/nitrite response regulator NarL
MTASALADGRYADRFVLVVDDHELVGASIVLALTARGTAARQCRPTSTKGILDFAARLSRRGVMLLDLDLGFDAAGTRIDEIELIREFSTRGWRVLVLSAVTDRRRVAAAIAAGSVGFVAKAAPLDELLDTVTAAADGRPVLSRTERATWVTLHEQQKATDKHKQVKLRRLTARERKILELLAQGERATVIAEEACVSLSTVRSQIRSILTKLEVNSQLEAAALLRDDP